MKSETRPETSKGTFRAPVIVDANQLVAIATTNPIIYSPNPKDTELKLADSPFDINPLSINNLQRNLFDDITRTMEHGKPLA